MTTKDQAIAPISRDADADLGKVLSVYGSDKPAPDCRTCGNLENDDYIYSCKTWRNKGRQSCTKGDQYQPALKVVLWRTV